MNQAQLLNLLRTGRYAILTAGKPMRGESVAHSSWLQRAGDLLCDLRTLSYQPLSLIGYYQGERDGISYLVPDMDSETALGLGRRYGQAEVVLPEGMADTETGEVAPWTGRIVVGPEAKRAPYHSVLVESGLAFSLDFDLSLRIPRRVLCGATN